MWTIERGRHPGTLKGINSDEEQLSAPNHSIMLWHRARRYALHQTWRDFPAIRRLLLKDQAVAMSYAHIDERPAQRRPDLSPTRVIRTMQGQIRLAQPWRPYLKERWLAIHHPVYGDWAIWTLDEEARLGHELVMGQARLRMLAQGRGPLSVAMRYWSPHTRSR